MFDDCQPQTRAALFPAAVAVHPVESFGQTGDVMGLDSFALILDGDFNHRAKGQIMDAHGLSEHEAFSFIQKRAMQERQTMKAVAERVIAGQLAPEPKPSA